MPLFLVSKYHCTSISCIFACRCCCSPPRSFSTYLSDRCSADLPTLWCPPLHSLVAHLLLVRISCSSHRRPNQFSGCRGGTGTRRVYLFNLSDRKRVDWIHCGLLMSFRHWFLFFFNKFTNAISISRSHVSRTCLTPHRCATEKPQSGYTPDGFRGQSTPIEYEISYVFTWYQMICHSVEKFWANFGAREEDWNSNELKKYEKLRKVGSQIIKSWRLVTKRTKKTNVKTCYKFKKLFQVLKRLKW